MFEDFCSRIVTSDILYEDAQHDKWGNTRLQDGTVSLGPLGRSGANRVKRPRIFHWSNPSKDDKVLADLSMLQREEVMKHGMKGEQT